jgi:type III pantothenate kinase
MILAIDVGNTHTVFGVKVEGEWLTWRRHTDVQVTEDELAAWLRSMVRLAGLPWQFSGVIVGSVVPSANDVLSRLAEKWLKVPVKFLRGDAPVGLVNAYSPPSAVGPDRIANALAALELFAPPLIVVDFGTATTFDVIDEHGTYLGGAILPGPEVAATALVGRTARLPQFELNAPESAIGRTTIESLQAGLVLGYADMIDGLCGRIQAELGRPATVIATGGLAKRFQGLCKSLTHLEPSLTLEGLMIARERLS